jgi:aromatic amino acid aminotransferase I
VPGVVSLSAGFPPPHVFPFSNISLQLTNGTQITLPDITAAQQYNASLLGYPPLVHWATSHVQSLHRPPSPHDILITNGANHSLELITSLFLQRGDAILVEEYTYPVILESIAMPKGYRTVGVPIDNHGIIPSELERVLEEAASAAAIPGGHKMPKLMYTVPTGHNPTGCSITPERRRQVYALCRKFDIWIVEDDPYFYLQWGSAAQSMLEHESIDPEVVEEAALRAAMPGLQGLVRNAAPSMTRTPSPSSSSSSIYSSSSSSGLSMGNNDTMSNSTSSSEMSSSYLALDIDCRVIRVDTFSKFLAPGVRLGWVTARSDVIEKLTSALQTHTVGPCSLSQTVVASTLAAWGEAGLDAHLRQIQAEYARRCAVLCRAAARELSGGLAEWHVPRAGMFLWVKINGVEDAVEVWDALHDAKVIVCPGRVMAAAAGGGGGSFRQVDNAHIDQSAGVVGNEVKSPFVRVAFSSVDSAGLKEGMKRLGSVLRKHHQDRLGGGGQQEDMVVV